MAASSVVIVSGPPASGKSHLAARLASDLGWIYISKDHIKERLFNSLGCADRASSRELGRASFELLLQFAAQLFSASTPFVMESAFRASDGPILSKSITAGRFLQVYCHTGVATLMERFSKRASSGERHPGHLDHELLDELHESLASGVYGVLDLPGELVRVDTSDFESPEFRDGYFKILRLCS